MATISERPNKLAVTVSVPLALTVSTVPNNESSSASKGGTFKVGGVEGDGGGEEGNGGTGAGFTVSVKICVKSLPTPLNAVIVK